MTHKPAHRANAWIIANAAMRVTKSYGWNIININETVACSIGATNRHSPHFTELISVSFSFLHSPRSFSLTCRHIIRREFFFYLPNMLHSNSICFDGFLSISIFDINQLGIIPFSPGGKPKSQEEKRKTTTTTTGN